MAETLKPELIKLMVGKGKKPINRSRERERRKKKSDSQEMHAAAAATVGKVEINGRS